MRRLCNFICRTNKAALFHTTDNRVKLPVGLYEKKRQKKTGTPKTSRLPCAAETIAPVSKEEINRKGA
jgi:hypothetical protein